jgi:hypothetical protein
MEKHPLHRKIPDLQSSAEVDSAVKKQERLTTQKIPNNPNERIDAYLKRLEQLVLDLDNSQEKKDLGDVLHTNRPRALSLLREKILDEYIRPNKEKMAEGAAMVEERAARQMGLTVEYGDEQLEQRGGIAIGDLESSLDQWITYLSDKNEPYPVWFRYYAFRNILNLGEYDKDKQEFPKRSRGTFKLFPDVDRGALAYVEQMMEAAQDETILNRIRTSQQAQGNTPEHELLTEEKAKAFAAMTFAKQYAEGIQQNGEITPELRAETRGQWVRYQQGTDPTALWLSLQNKGTAWCTKGYPTAETQLKGGDFYVYYTLDATGKPSIPRIAIRMEGETAIAENPRGVFDAQQNLEPNMVDILEDKLKEFGPASETFKKKSHDMRLLTEIEKKTTANEALTKDELVFLYEINESIEGFGYEKDPRVEELRSKRNPKEDAPIVFECAPEEIAWQESDINEQTKAYIGQFFPGIFNTSIENIFTSFPEGKIQRHDIEIGGKTKNQLKAELQEKNVYVSSYADDLLDSKAFEALSAPEDANLISLTVGDLGFDRGATTDEIYRRAGEYGLELCPSEVGPQLRLSYTGNDWMYIAMKQIADRDGSPSVFRLSGRGGALWLYAYDAEPSRRWGAGHRFVFRHRKTLSP